VFLVSGFWHGAGWTFVLWGCAHGIAMILHRIWSKVLHCAMPRILGVVLTFLFVDFAWILFRAEDFRRAKRVFGGFLKFSAETGNSLLAGEAYVWILAAFGICFLLPPAYSFIKGFRTSIAAWIVTLALLVVSICYFTRYSPFIYFNF